MYSHDTNPAARSHLSVAGAEAETGAFANSAGTRPPARGGESPAGGDLAAIGLSPRAGWYVGAALYGVGGALVLALYFLTASLPRADAVLGGIALLSAPLMLLGARLAPTASWGAPLRISFGIAIIGGGGFLIGSDQAPAFELLILFPILSSAYLHTPRGSIPFVVAGVASVTVALVLDHQWASAMTSAVTTSMLATAAILSQYQLRRVASLSRKQSVTDPLTGFGNVRRLRARLLERLLATQRTGERIAVLALDLDDFKQVNDIFSHTRGDVVLRTVADAISAQLASGDLLARRGGDEFVMLCDPLGDRDPDEICTRLIAAVVAARREMCPDINPGVSVGYALNERGESVDELLTRADVALHEAKLRAHPERAGEHAVAHSVRPQVRKAPPLVRNAAQTRALTQMLAASAKNDQSELQIARWVANLLGTGQAWGIAAAVNVVVGTTLTTLALTHVMPRLGDATGVTWTAGFYVLAVLCVAASRRRSSWAVLQLVIVCTGALMTIVFIHAGSGRWALLDLYTLPIMFAFYFLRPIQALPYLVVGLGALAGLLAASHVPLALPRTVVTTIVVGMMAGLLVKARKSTRSFTERAIEISVIDPLTGIANLRGLRQRVADEIDRCNATSMQLALVTIDLDDFKSVNDRYSHAMGDTALAATAQAIRAQVRTGDLVARRGGDEFAVLSLREGDRTLDAMMERIARAIEHARRELCADLPCTAGISCVVWRAGESSGEFFARADAALHAVKAQESHAKGDDRLTREPTVVRA